MNINIRSNENKCNLKISNNSIEHNNMLAKEWATKTEGKVEDIDFSAKQYALNAKVAANEALETKDSILNNAGFIAISEDLSGENSIGICAENIVQIQNASDYAQNALSSAQSAETYSQQASAQAEMVKQQAANMYTAVASCANVGLSNLSSDGITKIKTTVNYESTQSQLALPHVTQTYVNGTSWYRVWSDGLCEQGGVLSIEKAESVMAPVTFLKTYNSLPIVTSTIVSLSYTSTTGTANINSVVGRAGTLCSLKESGFQFCYIHKPAAGGYGDGHWYACGYIN